jgi:hypothetical protein
MGLRLAKTFDIDSPLSHGEAVERIRSQAQEWRPFAAWYAHMPFHGTISDDGFKVRRIARLRSMPTIRGTFHPALSGTKVAVEVRDPSDLAVLAFVIILGLFNLELLVAALRGQNDMEWAFIAGFVVWLVAYLWRRAVLRSEVRRAKTSLSVALGKLPRSEQASRADRPEGRDDVAR